MSCKVIWFCDRTVIGDVKLSEWEHIFNAFWYLTSGRGLTVSFTNIIRFQRGRSSHPLINPFNSILATGSLIENLLFEFKFSIRIITRKRAEKLHDDHFFFLLIILPIYYYYYLQFIVLCCTYLPHSKTFLRTCK